MTRVRLRDGQEIYYGWDALGRLVSKDVPPNGVHGEVDQDYAWDLMGNLVTASDKGGRELGFAYDALGRLTGQTDSRYSAGSATFSYDAAGRRVGLTYAGGFRVNYVYDAAGAVTSIAEDGGIELARYGYDDLGRRVRLVRGNGVATDYRYDAGSRLDELKLDPAGTAHDLTLGFTHDAAGRIASRTASNDAYAWTGAVNVDRPYQANALNQYVAAGATGFSYDGRGNLAWSGQDHYVYTAENRLAEAPGRGWRTTRWAGCRRWWRRERQRWTPRRSSTTGRPC